MATRENEQRSNRGFASMDKERQRQIAAQGGRAAHMKGTAHEFTSEEARAAGRKGGEAVSGDRAHMAEIGRKGGQSQGSRGTGRRNDAHARVAARDQRSGQNTKAS